MLPLECETQLLVPTREDLRFWRRIPGRRAPRLSRMSCIRTGGDRATQTRDTAGLLTRRVAPWRVGPEPCRAAKYKPDSQTTGHRPAPSPLIRPMAGEVSELSRCRCVTGQYFVILAARTATPAPRRSRQGLRLRSSLACSAVPGLVGYRGVGTYLSMQRCRLRRSTTGLHHHTHTPGNSAEWVPAGSSHGCHRCYAAALDEGQSE
jgi:hypothetical protein